MWSTPGALRRRQRVVQRHRVRVAEVELAVGLGDDDRPAPVGGEVQVVRVQRRDRLARAAGARVDRREAVAEVVGRRTACAGPTTGVTCWGSAPTGKCSIDLERPLGDHVDGVRLAVGHVDERRVAAHDGAEQPGAVGGVDVRAARASAGCARARGTSTPPCARRAAGRRGGRLASRAPCDAPPQPRERSTGAAPTRRPAPTPARCMAARAASHRAAGSSVSARS